MGQPNEPQLTEREAVDMMRGALGFIAPRAKVLSVAAYGLVWRNRRIQQLEQMVLKRGGWPWPKERAK